MKVQRHWLQVVEKGKWNEKQKKKTDRRKKYYNSEGQSLKTLRTCLMPQICDTANKKEKKKKDHSVRSQWEDKQAKQMACTHIDVYINISSGQTHLRQ